LAALRYQEQIPWTPIVLTNNATPLAQLFSDFFYPRRFIGERERIQKCHVGGFEDLPFSVFREFGRDFVSLGHFFIRGQIVI